MLADTTSTPIFEYLLFPIAVVVVIAIARAVTKTFGKSQKDSQDKKDLSAFLFDSPPNASVGTPGREGWTTKVDRTLEQLAAGQRRTERAVREVLLEIKPDGNGRDNLRGVVDRAAQAAGVERDRLHEEEGR